MNANPLDVDCLQVAITGVNIVKFLDMEEGFCAGARDDQQAAVVHPSHSCCWLDSESKLALCMCIQQACHGAGRASSKP